MKRLLQSKNFVCEIQQAGKRFLITTVGRSDAEWKNLGHQVDRHVKDWKGHDSFLFVIEQVLYRNGLFI